MTSPNVSISVVVPAYNEESALAELLESLTKQVSSQPFEVIVVNNASTDRTREVAEQFQNNLNLIVIDEPKKGRGAARAAGFNRAQGEIIFSTDADAIVPSHWITALSSHFASPAIVAVSGTCRVQDLTALGNTVVNIVMPLAMRGFSLLYGTPWLTGSNFAIRKSAYQASGGFDPTITAIEDVDLTLRVKTHGRIKMVSNVPIVTSGRRFVRHGVLQGLLSYVRSFQSLRRQNLHNATLDDPR